MELAPVLTAAIIWILCAALWARFGVRHFGDPVFLYLLFHFVSFVLRPWFLYKIRDESYLRDYIGVWLLPQDHARALWQSNLGLVGFTIAGLIAGRVMRQRSIKIRPWVIDGKIVGITAAALLLLCVASYLRYSGSVYDPRDPFATLGPRQVIDSSQGFTVVNSGSTYLTNFYNVTMGVFIALIAFRGFRWHYLPLILAYFGVVLYQGTMRTLYLTGGLALVLVLLAYQKRGWPSLPVTTLLFLAALSFAGGKFWFYDVVTGDTEAVARAKERIELNLQGNGETFLNYDVMAMTTYVIPRYADYSTTVMYGRLLYGWMPRRLWPDKPVFDFPTGYIASKVQEVEVSGLTVTLVGESYMAFGTVSVLVLMSLYGAIFGGTFAWSLRYPIGSVQRIFGIAMSVTLVEVARDGIGQILPFFLMIYFGPCLCMWGAGVVTGRAWHGTEPQPQVGRGHEFDPSGVAVRPRPNTPVHSLPHG